MIDIKELKLYNYVKCKVSNDAGIYRTIALDGMNLKIMLDGARYKEWHNEDKIKPIPINEKWLLKLKFQLLPNKEEYIKKLSDANSILIKKDKKYFDILFSTKGKYYSFRRRYIHELQNLFYEFTKENLMFDK